MTEWLLGMAKDLTVAHIQAGQVTPQETESVLSETYSTLQRLGAAPQATAVVAAPRAPGMWKDSITEHDILCLECGASFRQLSSRHLRVHEMNGHSYRAKYGIPSSQSLSAHKVLRRRREILQDSRPWEKARTRQKGEATQDDTDTAQNGSISGATRR